MNIKAVIRVALLCVYVIFLSASVSGEAIDLPALLSTGQTTPYIGNDGAIGIGNRDDGDLIRGRLPQYAYSPIYPATTQSENVISDLNTGLMWIRDMSVLDGSDGAGVGGEVDFSEGAGWLTTVALVESFSYAGYDDWRLPTLKEMQTLVDYGTSEPSIDTVAFPTPFGQYPSHYFWTSTTDPDRPNEAFYVNFLNGHTYPFKQSIGLGVRPVREITVDNPITLLQTGQIDQNPAGLAHSYTFADDGTIDTQAENIATDDHTQLMWIRDPFLVTGDDAAGVAGTTDLSIATNWQSAIDRANQLSYGGHDDWRLPNLVELETLNQAGNPERLMDAIFQNAPVDPDDPEAHVWWSSTTSAYDRSADEPGREAAWYVTSAFGSTNFVEYTHSPFKLRPGYIRPVRDVISSPDTTNGLAEVRGSAEWLAITIPSINSDVIRQGKFLLPLENSDLPFEMAFQNVTQTPLHYDYLIANYPDQMIGVTEAEYTALASQRDTRELFAGGLREFNDAAGNTVYGFDLYIDQTDSDEQLTQDEIAQIYGQLLRHFRRRPLVYSPTQPNDIATANQWANTLFPIAYPETVAAPDFQAYTTGETYGTIRLLTLAQLHEQAADGLLSRQDIVIVTDGTPTDLETVVAGIITALPQSELAHLPIRTARRGTVNGYMADPAAIFAPYDGQLIRLSLGQLGYYIEENVDVETAMAWWEAERPDPITLNAPNLTYDQLDGLTTIGAQADAVSKFGGKAANLGKLFTFLDAQYQVPGFGIPMYYYDQFLQMNSWTYTLGGSESTYTYAQFVEAIHQDDRFLTDSVYRADVLNDFYDEIRDNGQLDPAWVSAVIGRTDEIFGAGTKVRFRSSSNAEDDLAFNGAGLYDSTSGCTLDSLDADTSGPSLCEATQSKERTVERAMLKVWAGLWTFRAWEERAYYGIDQTEAKMGILVSLAFPDERANGVAFTGDPTGATAGQYLINVQQGDTSVVLPESGVVPERDQLVIENGQISDIVRVRASSLISDGTWVMSDAELLELGAVMLDIEQNYPVELPASGEIAREDVLLDLEFKIDTYNGLDDQLLIKQIRPFLLNSASTQSDQAMLRVVNERPINLCGQWREGFGWTRELDEKAVLRIDPTSFYLSLQDNTQAHHLFDQFSYGYPFAEMASVGDGAYEIAADATNSNDVRITLSQTFSDGSKTIDLSVTLPAMNQNQFQIWEMDAADLLHRAIVTGSVTDTNSGDEMSLLRFAPCGLPNSTDIVHQILFSDGYTLTLAQKREQLDTTINSLAELSWATWNGTMIESAANLTYAATRHHWEEQFVVLFDEVQDGHEGILVVVDNLADEPLYQAFWLGEGLVMGDEITISSVDSGIPTQVSSSQNGIPAIYLSGKWLIGGTIIVLVGFSIVMQRFRMVNDK